MPRWIVASKSESGWSISTPTAFVLPSGSSISTSLAFPSSAMPVSPVFAGSCTCNWLTLEPAAAKLSTVCESALTVSVVASIPAPITVSAPPAEVAANGPV